MCDVCVRGGLDTLFNTLTLCVYVCVSVNNKAGVANCIETNRKGEEQSEKDEKEFKSGYIIWIGTQKGCSCDGYIQD